MSGNDSQTAPVDSISERESLYFDSFVKEQGEFNPFLDRGWATLRKCFDDAIPLTSGVRLLDVGCGTGQSRQLYVPQIAPQNYTGLDLSAEAVAMANKKFPESEWIVGDACVLPFPAKSFDVVCFSSVLHHIPDFAQAVREADRILKPSGFVFAFDPNRLHPAMRLFRDPKSRFYRFEGVSPNERPLMPEELREAFDAASFTIVSQYAKSDLPYREVAPRGMNSILRVYNVLDKMWERSGMGRKYGTFIITVGQKAAKF